MEVKLTLERLSEDELPPEGRWLPRAVASVELVNARGDYEHYRYD